MTSPNEAEMRTLGSIPEDKILFRGLVYAALESLWYKAKVVEDLGEGFKKDSEVLFKRLEDGRYRVYSFYSFGIILTEEQAKKSLKTMRSPEGKPIPHPMQNLPDKWWKKVKPQNILTYKGATYKLAGKWDALALAMKNLSLPNSLLPPDFGPLGKEYRRVWNGWIEGGCLIFAEAFRKWAKKRLPLVLFGENVHVAVKIDKNTYVDYEGIHTLQELKDIHSSEVEPFSPSSAYKKRREDNIWYDQKATDRAAAALSKRLGNPKELGF